MSKKRSYLGIDIGTTYLKAGIYDNKGRRISYSESKLGLFNPRFNEFYQEPDEFYSKTLRCIKDCLSVKNIEPKSISGVAFSGQMGGIMAINKSFSPVIKYDIILDNRSHEYSKLLNQENFRRIYKKTGCISTYGSKIIYWSRDKEISKKIYKFIQPADYVSSKMCRLKSEDAFMSFSYLCWSGLCDGEKLEWSEEICNMFDINIKKLPRIVDTFEIVGYLDKKIAGILGLLSGIPVIAGGGDGSVTALGSGLNKPGRIGLLAGTANGIFKVVNNIYTNSKYRLNNQYSVFSNLKLLQNYDLSGKTHSWFMEKVLSSKDLEISFKQMEEKIKYIPPGSGKLIFLSDIRENDQGNKSCSGGWLGLNLSHTKEHMYRSILESITFNRYLDWLKIKCVSGDDSDEQDNIILMGGGAKSKIWGQIISDIFKKKVIIYKRNDFTTLGSAAIAAKGIGEILDLPRFIDDILEVSKIHDPDYKNHEKYIEFLDIYKYALKINERFLNKLYNFSEN